MLTGALASNSISTGLRKACFKSLWKKREIEPMSQSLMTSFLQLLNRILGICHTEQYEHEKWTKAILLKQDHFPPWHWSTETLKDVSFALLPGFARCQDSVLVSSAFPWSYCILNAFWFFIASYSSMAFKHRGTRFHIGWTGEGSGKIRLFMHPLSSAAASQPDTVKQHRSI